MTDAPDRPDTAPLADDLLKEEEPSAEQENPQELLPIIDLLRSGLGIDFSSYKTGTVGRRIRRRMEFCQENDPASYAARLATDPDELETLGRDLLIGVTEFSVIQTCFASAGIAAGPVTGTAGGRWPADLVGRLRQW